MIRFLYPPRPIRRIALLTAIAALLFGGCGSSVPVQQAPPVDEDLQRYNRAAQQAFENGKLQQAASFYRKALDRAYIRDDFRAIGNAQYNLAICLINLQSYDQAHALIQEAKMDMALSGLSRSADFLLLEATVLYLKEDSVAAWNISHQILTAIPQASLITQSKTHFLRGLIANKQGDTDRLREAIVSIGQPELPQLRADLHELRGHLAMAEQYWDEAVNAFEEATELRREVRDYRGMLKTLVLAGQASAKAGHANKAAARYLRAGRSAALQGRFDQAYDWLSQAEQIAESASEASIAQQARAYLRELQESQTALHNRSTE